MTQQIGIKFETGSEDRRNEFVAGLLALLDLMLDGSDKAVITYSHERPTLRGKQKTTTTTEWEAGQDRPTFWDIGLHVTQRDMFSGPPTRIVITREPIEPPPATTEQAASEYDTPRIYDGGPEIAVADVEQPAEPTENDDLGLFRRFVDGFAELADQKDTETEDGEAEE